MFEPMELSDNSVIVPICPSESTWVPPQNSSEVDPARTTRTEEPYLSPKKAMAPMSSASSREVSVVSTSMSVSTALLARAKTSSSSSRGRGRVMREVEAQIVGPDERPLLAHVVAQHGPQGRVEQVRRGVVAPDGLAALAVDGGQRVLSRPHLAGHARPVRHQPGHGVDRVLDLGHARLGHDGAGVAHLPAALGVERRAVQEDLDHPAAIAVARDAVAGRRGSASSTATMRAGTS